MLKALLVAAALLSVSACAEEATRPLPAPHDDVAAGDGMKTAVFAGGCFWGMEGVFEHVKGVKNVVSGYTGGSAANARYDRVEWGDTGHAESVRITYNPREVSYGRLLQVFFSVMDPTTANRQGPDSGPQYRSEIFAADAAERRVATAYIAQLSNTHAFSAPIVTRVSDAMAFYPAEAYHQDYLVKHPAAPYIVVNDLPKLEKLKALYPALYSPKPVSVAVR